MSSCVPINTFSVMNSESLFERYQLLPKPPDWDEGKTGVVLPAIDIRTQARVVIKYAPHDHIRLDAVRHNLRNEAKALQLVKSPYAPRYVTADYGSAGQMAFVVMEEAQGMRVEREIPEGDITATRPTFTPRERIQILMQFFDVMAAAHENGVINNDIDLKHLFWDRALQRLVVIDWGNATFSGNGREMGKDVSRSNTIIYALLMNKQALDGQELTLPPPDEVADLPPYPLEYHTLLRWAPRATAFPKETESPVSAQDLYEATRRWFLAHEVKLVPTIDQGAASWTAHGTGLPVRDSSLVGFRPFITVLRKGAETLLRDESLASECKAFQAYCIHGRWAQARETVLRNAPSLPLTGAQVLVDILKQLETTSEKPTSNHLPLVFKQLIVDAQIASLTSTSGKEQPRYVSNALLRLAFGKDRASSDPSIALLQPSYDDLELYFGLIRHHFDTNPPEGQADRATARKFLTNLEALGRPREGKNSSVRTLAALVELYTELMNNLRHPYEIAEKFSLTVPGTSGSLHMATQIVARLLELVPEIANEHAQLDRARSFANEETTYFGLIELMGKIQQAWLLDPHCELLFGLWRESVESLAQRHSEFAAQASGYHCYTELKRRLDSLTGQVKAEFESPDARYTSVESHLDYDLLDLPPFWEQKKELREYVYWIERCARAKLFETSAQAPPLSRDLWLTSNSSLSFAGKGQLLPLRPTSTQPVSEVQAIEVVTATGTEATDASTQEGVEDRSQGEVPEAGQVSPPQEVPVSLPQPTEPSAREVTSALDQARKSHKRPLRLRSLVRRLLLVGLVPLGVIAGIFLGLWLARLGPASATPTAAFATSEPTATISGAATANPTSQIDATSVPIAVPASLTPSPTETLPPSPTSTTTATPSPTASPTISVTITLSAQPPLLTLRRFPPLAGQQQQNLVLVNPQGRRDRGFIYSQAQNSSVFRTYREGELPEDQSTGYTTADFTDILNPGEIPGGIGLRGRIQQSSLDDSEFGIFLIDEIAQTLRAYMTTNQDGQNVLIVSTGQGPDQSIDLSNFFPSGKLSDYQFWLQILVNNGVGSIYLASRPIGGGEQLELIRLADISGLEEVTGLGLFGRGTEIDVIINELTVFGTTR